MPTQFREYLNPGIDTAEVCDSVLWVGEVSPGTRLRSVAVQWLAAPLWRDVPAALALADDLGVIGWNAACDALLTTCVEGSNRARERWLRASVLRLLASDLTSDVVRPGNGGQLALAVVLSPVLDDDGGRIVYLRPHTEASAGADDLVETVSTLAHELRTPLTSMKSSLGLVLGGDAGDLTDDQRRFLQMTTRNIDRLDRLVNELLDTSRADAARFALNCQDVDLGLLLHEAMDLLVAGSRTSGVSIDTTGLPAKLRARVDGDKIVQILNNIVGNALKYCRRGDRIAVTMNEMGSDAAPGLELVVADNGPGIPAANRERIFEPFDRGDHSQGGPVPGAGLGLTITRRLVEVHGGSIELDSRLGTGTTVKITLPRD